MKMVTTVLKKVLFFSKVVADFVEDYFFGRFVVSIFGWLRIFFRFDPCLGAVLTKMVTSQGERKTKDGLLRCKDHL